MAEKDTATNLPPATTNTTEGSSSPATPAAKRARVTSPDTATMGSEEAGVGAIERSASSFPSEITTQGAETGLFDDAENVEADDGYSDSGFGTDQSDTTSVTSSIFRGIIENGRRYQSVREGEYWGPSDDKQFESMEAGHIASTLLDADQKNPFFRSPLPATAQHILDVGTGPGEWARQVADMFPNTMVLGIDLTPPPDDWVPPNCKFEVDDVLKPWAWPHCFDLIHIRDLFGSFTDEQWRLLYKQIYKNLVPGGWIEQCESSIQWTADDGSIAPDSILGKWGELFSNAFNRMGKNINTVDTFKASIEAAGFTDVHEKAYKNPIGEWARNPILKESGKYHKQQMMQGLEGYVMFVLTKFGEPEPWTPEEVQVFLAKARKEFANPALHCYLLKRRVWARKPLGKDTAKAEVQAENVAE